MKQAMEVLCVTKNRIKPLNMRKGVRGISLTVKRAIPTAGRRIGKTLGITNRVIPVINSEANAEAVYFPVKILSVKAPGE